MPDILFIKPSNASFVQNDLQILQNSFSVKCWRFHFSPFLRLFWNEIILALWLLFIGYKSKVVYIWFADYHSVLPVIFCKLFQKKCLIVIGGYDVAKLPEFNYGAHLWRFRSFYIKTSFRWATLLLPVSKFAHQSLLNYAPLAPAMILYNGVNPSLFNRNNKITKRNIVLTVCGAKDVRSVRIKGIELFINIAKLLPNISFVIIGLADKALDYVKNLHPSSNLKIFGYVDQSELFVHYNKAKIYCQLSYYESFGLSLAEAMLCDCIPVVTACGALPEIAGTHGYILPSRCPDDAAQVITNALENYDILKNKSRDHIVRHFSLQKRERELINIIKPFLRDETKDS